MPCIDEYADYEAQIKQREEASFTRAALCGVLTVLQDSVGWGQLDRIMLERFPTEETGLDASQVLAWWDTHKIEDEKRRAEERARDKKEEARKAALKKLTKKERKLLGVE